MDSETRIAIATMIEKRDIEKRKQLLEEVLQLAHQTINFNEFIKTLEEWKNE